MLTGDRPCTCNPCDRVGPYLFFLAHMVFSFSFSNKSFYGLMIISFSLFKLA